MSTACPTLCRGHVWEDYEVCMMECVLKVLMRGTVETSVEPDWLCLCPCSTLASSATTSTLTSSVPTTNLTSSVPTTNLISSVTFEKLLDLSLPQFLPLWVEIVGTDLAGLKGKCLGQCLGIWWGNSNTGCFPLTIWWGSQSIGTIDKRTLQPCVLSGRKLLGPLIRMIHKRNTGIG